MTEEEIIKAISEVNGIEGMTVNQRLFTCGLMTEFETAMKTDKPKARKILELIKVDKPSIDVIVI